MEAHVRGGYPVQGAGDDGACMQPPLRYHARLLYALTTFYPHGRDGLEPNSHGEKNARDYPADAILCKRGEARRELPETEQDATGHETKTIHQMIRRVKRGSY